MDALEEPIENAAAVEALKARAFRIHLFALIAGLVFAGWTYLAWPG